MKKPIKVLTIEDDANIAELIQLYIEKVGFSSITAIDGEEGLEKIYNESPDCIILDLMLPKITGGEVCKIIRMEDKKIPQDIDYDAIQGLATEAREKLKQVQPLTLAQASRISGVNPADISILLVYLEQGKIKRVSNS